MQSRYPYTPHLSVLGAETRIVNPVLRGRRKGQQFTKDPGGHAPRRSPPAEIDPGVLERPHVTGKLRRWECSRRIGLVQGRHGQAFASDQRTCPDAHRQRRLHQDHCAQGSRHGHWRCGGRSRGRRADLPARPGREAETGCGPRRQHLYGVPVTFRIHRRVHRRGRPPPARPHGGVAGGYFPWGVRSCGLRGSRMQKQAPSLSEAAGSTVSSRPSRCANRAAMESPNPLPTGRRPA